MPTKMEAVQKIWRQEGILPLITVTYTYSMYKRRVA